MSSTTACPPPRCAAYGLTKLGVEQVKPIITRGILIDVAGFKGVDTLPSGYEVTLADVRGALARQGIQESELKPGDASSSTGWWRLWPDRAPRQGPGVGREVAAWIVERKASMVGSDATTDVAMAVRGGDAQARHLQSGVDALRRSPLRSRLRVPVRVHAAAAERRDRVARTSARDSVTPRLARQSGRNG